MADESRLAQLRALVARLERLPASPRREWMLEATRARMVDVETGFPPETMRPLDTERHTQLLLILERQHGVASRCR